MLRLHPNDALRSYSIYDADPDLGTLDVVMLDHDGDPDTVTTRQTLGDRGFHGGPRSIHPTRGQPRRYATMRPTILFAGEETASVAFAAMLRSLPAAAEVHGVIEAATHADHLPLARPLNHVERGEASAKDSAAARRRRA